ncbi:MAG: PaaI family thioesterase [Promethearchaeota archaeon]
MPHNNEKIKQRSKKMIELFNSFKEQDLSQFPVPPFTKWLNGRVINAKLGEIELEFLVRPEMANPTGLLHGGMQCALIDDVIGMMSATLGYEGFLISLDLHVNYLDKVKIGEKVRVKASVVRDGRYIAHAFAQILNSEGKLIATGNCNLLKTRFKPDIVKAVDETYK